MSKTKDEQQAKSCFIIMPISDSDDYETGHFKRVYEHIIKPACKASGYEAVRADDVAQSNYIIIDILRKILDSDLVICDISNQNPNVLYELGIRQAFNLPTVIIKDLKTQNIFDIQGLRYTEYNHTLRVDSVGQDIEKLRNTIIETDKLSDKDVNSIIKLLGIKPAESPQKTEISTDTSMILSAINDISSRLTTIEQKRRAGLQSVNHRAMQELPILKLNDGTFRINGYKLDIGDTVYARGEEVGKLVEVSSKGIYIEMKNGKKAFLEKDDDLFTKIDTIPF